MEYREYVCTIRTGDTDVMLCNGSLIPPWVNEDREWIHLMASRLIGETALMAVFG